MVEKDTYEEKIIKNDNLKDFITSRCSSEEDKIFFDLQKDLFLSFYKEHRDFEKAEELTLRALCYLSGLMDTSIITTSEDDKTEAILLKLASRNI